MKQIKIGKDAAREFEEAAAWYEKEQPVLGEKFIDAFESALELLGETNPPLTPCLGDAGSIGAKKLILHKFPFSMIVHEMEELMIVVALAHHSRKPGYWKDRVNP
jgi:plasmid stabilization system protein ParE